MSEEIKDTGKEGSDYSDAKHGEIVNTSPLFGDEDRPHEVFQKDIDGVNFRTVGWKRASMIFLKSMMSTQMRPPSSF